MKVLFPEGAKDQYKKNGVDTLFSARKCITQLITIGGGSKRQPGGILGNKGWLKKELDITVLSGTDAIELVRLEIIKRDARTR